MTGAKLGRRSALLLDGFLLAARRGAGVVLDRVQVVLESWAEPPRASTSAPADIYSCGPLKMTPEREAILERAKEKARAQRQG